MQQKSIGVSEQDQRSAGVLSPHGRRQRAELPTSAAAGRKKLSAAAVRHDRRWPFGEWLQQKLHFQFTGLWVIYHVKLLVELQIQIKFLWSTFRVKKVYKCQYTSAGESYFICSLPKQTCTTEVLFKTLEKFEVWEVKLQNCVSSTKEIKRHQVDCMQNISTSLSLSFLYTNQLELSPVVVYWHQTFYI